MPSPDPTDVERIEGLLRGMPPETERDARLEGMVRELRTGTPAAPPALRARVRGLGPPERRRTFGWRPLLVVAPLIVALLGAALLVGRIDDRLWLGAWQIGPALLHPLTLVYAASGSAMISATLRIPKP